MELQAWRQLLAPYELAVKELTVKFEHLQHEYLDRGEYCPIEEVTGRVKAVSSILEKARIKDIAMDEIPNRVEDIAGIRIICQFVEDIYTVVELIRNRTDMKVIEEIDYVANSKKSGYRSYHVMVRYVVQSSYGIKEIPVEIQIRTLAMNFWAIVEHSLQYKYRKNIPYRVSERLTGAADAAFRLDNEMTEIREEIKEAQSSFRLKASVVQDILNTLRSLSMVADAQVVMGLQNEFFRIYNESNIDELQGFYHKLDELAQTYRAQDIKGTFS